MTPPWPAALHHAAPAPAAIEAATADLARAGCVTHPSPEMRALAPFLAALRGRLAMPDIAAAHTLALVGDAATDAGRAGLSLHQALAWRALATALWQTSTAQLLAPAGRAAGQDDGALA